MFATVPESEESFPVDLETRALKKCPHTMNILSILIKRKFDKSLKNRQVQEKLELEPG